MWLSTKLLDCVEGLFDSWSLSKVQISQLWKEKVNPIDNNKPIVFSRGKPSLFNSKIYQIICINCTIPIHLYFFLLLLLRNRQPRRIQNWTQSVVSEQKWCNLFDVLKQSGQQMNFLGKPSKPFHRFKYHVPHIYYRHYISFYVQQKR